MKTLYTILSALMVTTLSFSQGNVKIISAQDNIDYAGDTVTISSDEYQIAQTFYVVNAGSTTAGYKYGLTPITISNSEFVFQLCDDGGDCYSANVPIGSLWIAPESYFIVDPGDTTEIKIQMLTMGFSGTGSANYYILDDNEEKLDSVHVIFTSTVSVATQKEIPTFKIYPNPAKEGVTIQGEGLKNGGTVLFIDALGQEVKRVHLSEMHTMINVSSLNKGVYFVSIFDENGTKSKMQRLIIQ